MENVANLRSNTVGAVLGGAILSTGMALAVVSILLFAWMADEVFEGDSLAFDNAAREFIHSYAAPWVTAMMQVFSFLGSTLFLTSVSVLLIVVFLIRRRQRPAIILATVMTGTIVLNYVLKIYFVRVRPTPYFDTPLPASFSFPSGHALFSACFYGIAAWLVSQSSRNASLQITAWAVAVFIVIFVGLSRIYLGVHFPTDVAAGCLAAIVWIGTIVSTNSVVSRRNSFISSEM